MSRDNLGNNKDGDSYKREVIDRYTDGKGKIDERGLAQAAKDLNLDPERLRDMNITVEKQRRGAD